MNRLVSLFGAIILALGASGYVLLQQLQTETFRVDLPQWLNLALLLTGAGAFALLAGVSLPSKAIGMIEAEKASKYFGYASLVNTVTAAVFASPVLIPFFEFPILITRWPGVYMVVAYLLFVVIGVLGSFAWSGLYRWMPELFGPARVYRPLFLFQFVGMEFAIYLLSMFMFWGGYVGSSINYRGFGDTVVGTAMEFAVIPAALGIFFLIVSNLVGVSNIILSRRNV